MEKILQVNSPNDYARYVGAEILHDDICVVHYDELEHCRKNSYILSFRISVTSSFVKFR